MRAVAVRQLAVGGLAAVLLAASYAVLRPPGDAVALATASEASSPDLEPVALAGVRSAGDPEVRTAVEPAAEAANDASAEGARPEDEPLVAAPADIRRWVDDLRDDDVPGNAGAAMACLLRAGAAALPALADTLVSPDRQQRHLAAVVLRRVDAPPTHLLCTVSVEALERDVSRELAATLAMPGAVSATRYLAAHARDARAALRFGLGSGDDQQRFLCAFLLACAGERDDVDRVSRELITHLGDNHIRGDAVMAANGLFRLGGSVGATLQSWQPYVDEQARSLLRLIELDLRHPPRNPRELRERAALQNVTTVYHDPALHFDVTRSRVPTW